MKEQFKHSPLVELIAEVHWETGISPQQPIMPSEPAQQHEEFFKSLTDEIATAGYVTSERLVPNGFPFPAKIPILRFRRPPIGNSSEEKAKQLATLFQVGAGLFTINAIQPYSCWDDFKEVIRVGLNALLKVQPCMRESGFFVTIRYVNAFGESLVGNQNLRQFMSENLGIKVSLPQFMNEAPASGDSTIPVMQIHTPLEFGSYGINFGEGKVNNHSALVMENVVAMQKEINADVEQMISEMTIARDLIHKSFVEMTKPLHKLMELM